MQRYRHFAGGVKIVASMKDKFPTPPGPSQHSDNAWHASHAWHGYFFM